MNFRRYHLDSNVLLRFFTGTPPGMFAAASKLLAEAERGEVVLELSPLVLAETAFTLDSFYQRPRKETARALREFLRRADVRVAEKERMIEALKRVEDTGVHLVDAYLVSGRKLPLFKRPLECSPNI